jgi:hypothetical protein
MRSLQLGIVVMMMIMRTPPDAAGTESKHSKSSHQVFSDARFWEDRMMLLIVVDDE